MKSLVDKVKECNKRHKSLLDNKSEYFEFREKMIEAGFDVNGRFTIPLMSRIGHGYKHRPFWPRLRKF